MIRKQDILDRAAEWRLRPEVVEKDYVLGWLLAGVATLPVREQWIFKGGTAIKKCYFETYRFSEDLDFSLLPEPPYNQDELGAALRTLAERVTELSGLQFPTDAVVVRTRQNRQGQQTFEGRVGYRGPLAYPGTPKVLFDFTQHEPVIESPLDRPVLHPYPDELPQGTTVRVYSFDELLAEKTRALFERSRPRDLYDVVHLLQNGPRQLDLRLARSLFSRKCETKGLTAPTATTLLAAVGGDAELRSEWDNMLAHQLPALPNLDAILATLPGLLGWIDPKASTVLPESRLAAPPVPTGSMPIAAPGIRYWGSGLPLEAIRFAGSNRLLVEFDYHDRRRVVEPYSVRRAATTGNILLNAWEIGSTHIKAFNVAEMRGVRVTATAFTPRYRVELSEQAVVSAHHTTGVHRPPRGRPTAVGAVVRRQTPGGPRYVFQCPHCHKRFTHRTNNAALRRHRRADGRSDCPGRHGHLVGVR